MDKQSKALINEIYRLAGATAVQVQNLRSCISHLESKITDMHTELLKKTPAPPEPPRLSAQFAQFMQEDMERRGYIYRYARYPEYRKLWMDTDLYFKTHTNLYDNEAFLKLLAELPPRCII